MRVERLSLKDKQNLKYLLQTNEKTAVPETDSSGDVEFIEVDGELVQVETGSYQVGHEQKNLSDSTTDNIVEFEGNISFSGDSYFFSGGMVSREFGIDESDYDAVLLMPRDSLPIKEASYIWYDSEPVYEDELTGRVDVSSADYKVVKIIPSLGVVRYLLRAVIH